MPPPGITAVASPAPSPPCSASFSGIWKYCEMPLRAPAEVEPSSHINRKKAIIAVTKSA
ncbi:hypothetical protein D3C72_2004490 [compost metagenome]